jgi:formate dehydrogenase iron-sulfur subunit
MELTNGGRGLLFDATLCIGCGACYQACRERNGLPAGPADFREEVLSESTYTTVSPRGGRFVRQLCMHCRVPTCVASCPVGALEKTPLGPVVYREQRCIGCRYCVQACPFSIPRYEWSARLPRVRKCDLCADRLAAGLPNACASVCPTGATKAGARAELLVEARGRIERAPTRYFPHVYGEREAGGTAVLLIADRPLEELGYPSGLGGDPIPILTWNVLSQVPRFAVAAGIGLAGLWWITQRREEVARAEQEES